MGHTYEKCYKKQTASYQYIQETREEMNRRIPDTPKVSIQDRTPSIETNPNKDGKTIQDIVCNNIGATTTSVTDMKARTMSLTHGRVIKATLNNLRTMSLAHGRVMKDDIRAIKGQYRHSPRVECQRSEEQPQTSISHHSSWASVNIRTSSVAKKLHHSPMGE